MWQAPYSSPAHRLIAHTCIISPYAAMLPAAIVTRALVIGFLGPVIIFYNRNLKYMEISIADEVSVS